MRQGDGSFARDSPLLDDVGEENNDRATEVWAEELGGVEGRSCGCGEEEKEGEEGRAVSGCSKTRMSVP